MTPLPVDMHIRIACATVANHMGLKNAGAQVHLRADVGRHMHHVVGAGCAAKRSVAETRRRFRSSRAPASTRTDPACSR
eukprot:4094334-Pyramimonas_sp.AAC.1